MGPGGGTYRHNGLYVRILCPRRLGPAGPRVVDASWYLPSSGRNPRVEFLAGHLPGAMLPLDYETDREILDVALSTIGLVDPPDARLLWIRNTLELAELECSAAYLEEARRRDDLEILTGLGELPLDASGNLRARA